MPLKAKLAGSDFFSWDLTKENRRKEFRCPICDDKFIPVIPRKNIVNHFRHKTESRHKAESAEHLMLKQKIYQTSKQAGHACTLEKIIKSDPTNIRVADVVIDNKFVIEAQCSLLSAEELLKRHTHYHECGYSDIWILGGQYYQKTVKFEQDFGRSGDFKIWRIPEVAKLIFEEFDQSLIFYCSDAESLFEADLTFKHRRGSRGSCSSKGWYKLHELDFIKFFK